MGTMTPIENRKMNKKQFSDFADELPFFTRIVKVNRYYTLS